MFEKLYTMPSSSNSKCILPCKNQRFWKTAYCLKSRGIYLAYLRNKHIKRADFNYVKQEYGVFQFALGEKKHGSVNPHTCLTLCNPMDCSLPGFSVHGILQATILEWVDIWKTRLLIQETWETPRFNLWVRKIPWRRAWQLTPLVLPGEYNGQRSLVGYSP